MLNLISEFQVADIDLVISKLHKGHLWYFCGGCKIPHSVPVDRWQWNYETAEPTLHPSVRHFYRRPDGQEVTTCHYFLRSGVMLFCDDSNHSLAGKHVKLEPFDLSKWLG